MSEGRTLGDLAGAVEPIQALNAALAAAQGEFPAIVATDEVDSRSFKFKYAPLDQILKAIRPVLAKHGLALLQPIDGDSVRTELRHKDGGLIYSNAPIPPWQTPQQWGSSITYARRYAAAGMLGIAAEPDDDGEAAAGAGRAQKEQEEPEEPKLTRDERNVIEQIDKLWKQGRSLDELLGNEPRDWTLWSRHEVGLVGNAPSTAAHWKQLIPKLQDEIARMQAELEQRSEQETLLDEAEQAALAAEAEDQGEFRVPTGKRGDGGR